MNFGRKMEKLKAEEGFMLGEENIYQVMTGPHEVYKAELIKAWMKAGRPPCRMVGPRGNVFQFSNIPELGRFIYFLPRLWEYLSPGGFGGGADISRQATHYRIFREGTLLGMEVKRAGQIEVRYVLFKTKVDMSNHLW